MKGDEDVTRSKTHSNGNAGSNHFVARPVGLCIGLNDNNPRLYYVNGNWVGSPGAVSIAVRPQGTLDGGSGILQFN